MPLPPILSFARIFPAKTAAVLLFAVHTAGLAQPITTGSSTTAPAGTTRKVLLIGDQPSAGQAQGSLTPAQVTTAAATALKAPVVDLTRRGMSLQKTQKNVGQYIAERPRAVILFAGAADEAAGTQIEAMQYSLQSLARALTEAGARVFVLPSSTSLGAEAAANLHIATGGAGEAVEFVELGGELSGRPYETALEEVAKLLEQPAPAPVARKPVSTPPPAEPTPSLVLPSAPENSTTTTAGTTPKPKKQPELPPALASPPAEEQPQSSRSPGQAPAGKDRVVTATTIQMRPPVPVKQFDPKRPVRAKDLNKKDPSFSR